MQTSAIDTTLGEWTRSSFHQRWLRNLPLRVWDLRCLLNNHQVWHSRTEKRWLRCYVWCIRRDSWSFVGWVRRSWRKDCHNQRPGRGRRELQWFRWSCLFLNHPWWSRCFYFLGPGQGTAMNRVVQSLDLTNDSAVCQQWKLLSNQIFQRVKGLFKPGSFMANLNRRYCSRLWSSSSSHQRIFSSDDQ